MMGNAATWALAFVAGPGFGVAVGATISPAAAHPGLMPLIPVLAALPDEAVYPRALYAVLLLPVAAGAVMARWVDRELEFFGNVRARFAAVTTAAGIAVAVVVVLTALGNGSLGRRPSLTHRPGRGSVRRRAARGGHRRGRAPGELAAVARAGRLRCSRR